MQKTQVTCAGWRDLGIPPPPCICRAEQMLLLQVSSTVRRPLFSSPSVTENLVNRQFILFIVDFAVATTVSAKKEASGQCFRNGEKQKKLKNEDLFYQAKNSFWSQKFHV